MRIAVASEGRDENAMVSMVSGRAPYYIIFEDENIIEVIKNPFAFGGGGAGFGVSQMLINKGVQVVISGRFGPNMASSLTSRNVKIVELQGITVKEAVKRVLNSN